jgi:protein-disulfide isomerase
MTYWKTRASLAALFATLLMGSADHVACAADAEPAKLEPAVQAYADKLQADKDTAQAAAITKADSRITGDPGTQVLGNPKGDVTIVEFFDYQCPYCKADEPALQQLLKDDHGVKLILKEFPILGVPSLAAAKAALAVVPQDKYEPFHQALLAHKGHLDADQIDGIATEAGVDLARMHKDQIAPEIADAIIYNFNLARSLKITGTPGFVVGGKILSSPSTEEDFKKAVAEARKKG